MIVRKLYDLFLKSNQWFHQNISMFEIYFHGYWWRVDSQIKCDKTIRSMAKDD